MVGLFDSPLDLDISPLYPANVTSIADRSEMIYKNFNATSDATYLPPNPSCESKYHENKKHRCNIGQYRMHDLRSPYLMFADQFDDSQLEINMF